MIQRIAIPTANGHICAHFGHCEAFTVVETEDGKVSSSYFADPPEHQPGTYPKFLVSLGVTTVIAGGMGYKAQELLRQNGIEVIIGASGETPKALVEKYLKDELESGGNLCDH